MRPHSGTRGWSKTSKSNICRMPMFSAKLEDNQCYRFAWSSLESNSQPPSFNSVSLNSICATKRHFGCTLFLQQLLPIYSIVIKGQQHQCSASQMHEWTKNLCPQVSMLHKYCCINKQKVSLGSGSCWWQSLFSYSTYTTLQPPTHCRCLTCRCPGGVRDTFSEPLETVSAPALTWDPRATADFSPCWASCRGAH